MIKEIFDCKYCSPSYVKQIPNKYLSVKILELIGSYLLTHDPQNKFKNSEILNVLQRLEAGAKSLNPYWINASKKLAEIHAVLAGCGAPKN